MSEIRVDTISEKTSANGVTIDGLTIKDGNIIGDVALAGTTPTFTIGDAGAEDAALIFDGNALDYYIALDDSADDLVIGTGSTIGSNAKIVLNSDGKILIGDVASHTSDLFQIETPASGGGHGVQIRRNDANSDQQIGTISFGNNTDTDLAQIVAKTDGDSNSGDSGALLFKTQITGGASTERMKISSTGATTITVTDNTDTLTLISTDADANVGPVLNLKRSSSSPADNDLLGEIKFSGLDSGGGQIVYFRLSGTTLDVTDNTEDGKLVLTQTVASNDVDVLSINATETVFNEGSADKDFRVEGNGNGYMLFVDAGNDRLGIGEPSPDAARLHVKYDQSNNRIAKFEHSNATPEGLDINFSGAAPDNSSANFIECSDTGATRFIIVSDGDVQNHDNAYGAISDERIKQDIRDSSSQWNDIKAVKVRNFKKKDDVRQYGDNAWEQIGVVAQELEAVSPKLIRSNDPSASDIISSSEFGTLYADGDDIPEGKKIGDVKEIKEQVKSVNYSILYMKAIKALQEAMARIEALENA